MLDPGWFESHTNAPEPIGFVLHFSELAWYALGETSMPVPYAMVEPISGANGFSKVILRVDGSSTVKVEPAQSGPALEPVLGSLARSQFHLMSSAVRSLPSWNLMPLRTCTTNVLPPSWTSMPSAASMLMVGLSGGW
jgi:hypothetical protein